MQRLTMTAGPTGSQRCDYKYRITIIINNHKLVYSKLLTGSGFF
jgi:hypothetical protein